VSKPGQLTAKPPVSPQANLRPVERIGTNKSGSAVWKIVCTCGVSFDAIAPSIRRGETKCPRCQPSTSDMQAMEILMLLPATYDALERKLGVPLSTAKSRVRAMRKNDLCHTGKWKRPDGAGAFQPVIVAGPGEDAPCTLTARTNADYKRKYRSRVMKAIAKAEAGGKEDPRYIRHIRLRQVNEKVQQAKAEPQTWFSALIQPKRGDNRLPSDSRP
jgi:hypothetical protein